MLALSGLYQLSQNISMRLKCESPDPWYVQLKDLLRSEIETGHHRVNDRLPSKRKLANHYQVRGSCPASRALELSCRSIHSGS